MEILALFILVFNLVFKLSQIKLRKTGRKKMAMCYFHPKFANTSHNFERNRNEMLIGWNEGRS